MIPAKPDFDERPPIRLVTRLLAEMQTAIVAAGLPEMGGNLDRFMIFTLIVRQSRPRLGAEGDAVPAAISAYSLAASLSRPYETVRRHANALVAMGLCERGPGGLSAAPAGLRTPEFAALLARAHDCFVRFVEDLAMLGVPMPHARGCADYAPVIAIEAAADILLAVADTNRRVHSDWAGLVVFSSVLCANTGRVARDTKLAWRHADARVPVPAALLHPVRPSIVARTIGMTESTVRRRVAEMLADGRLEQVRGGLLVSQAWLNRPESIAISMASYGNIRRILERIAAAGFPFDDPARAYLQGRPADVVLAQG